MRVTSCLFKASTSNLALSFSGCGFLGAYNFGAAKCILTSQEKKIWPQVKRVAGASAGSLVASVMVLAPEKIDAAIEALYATADDVHSLPFGALTPGYFINERLIKLLDVFLPDDISNAMNDNLFVSVTKIDTWENVLVSNFDSRDHLIACLLASCYIPMYSLGLKGKPPMVNKIEFIDGGMTNNLPIFEDYRTITCSPFSSVADICPEDPEARWNYTFANQVFSVNGKNLARGVRALFPPTRRILQAYHDRGYEDADRFLKGFDLNLLKNGK